MIHLFLRRAIFLLVVLAMAPAANADWINLTGAETSPNIAEIYVLDDHVKLVLEVYIGDLDKFEDLVPDGWLKDSAAARPDVDKRIKRFAEQRFQFVTESGEKLPAQLQLVEPRMRTDRQSPFAGMINPMTRQRVPEAPQDKRVLYAEIIYPYASKPRELTIIPPLDDEGRAQVSIGFIAYHKAVPIIDFRYLGAAAHLLLDWDDPWYSKFDNPNLKRHHKSALMSFLYVEPFEVRHEILTRVKDLETWMDLGLRGDEYIEVDELEPLKQRIGDFLLTQNPVLVDGKALKPILDRTNYVKVSITGIQLVEKPERLEISTAIVGVIIAYITEGLPQQVTVDWQLFTDQVQRVPATATDPAGPLPSFVTPDDNVLIWTNFLKNYRMPTVQQVAVADTLGDVSIPVGSILFAVAILPVGWRLRAARREGKPLVAQSVVILVLLGGTLVSYPYTQISVAKPVLMAGELDDEQARQLLQALLKNVYRAFDFRDENDVYDKLALSVEGDLLTDIYLQNRKSFAVQKAGGAQAKVKDVDIQHARAERQAGDTPTYAIRSQWTATGTVGHWGHVHTRRNQYDAIVTVKADRGDWKISGLELLEEQRIDPAAPGANAAR
jgi:DNA-binding protein Fis